jgi:hypothetical protein
MPDQENKETNAQSQKGAPQETQDMPSSRNSPPSAGVTGDVEREGGTGTATGTQRTSERGAHASTGDPGRTPGKAEGVADPKKEGNE